MDKIIEITGRIGDAQKTIAGMMIRREALEAWIEGMARELQELLPVGGPYLVQVADEFYAVKVQHNGLAKVTEMPEYKKLFAKTLPFPKP